MMNKSIKCYLKALLGTALVSLSWYGHSAVLPEDRADAMYHSFEGGGVKIDGPSVLVRKSFLNKFSVSANYYVDNVSSASIDVLATASRYTEQRKEHSQQQIMI